MNLNKNQKYFMKLQQYFTRIIYEKYDSKIIEIAKIQNRSKQVIIDEIGNILLKYTIKDDSIGFSNRDRILLRSRFENLINGVFTDEIKFESSICNEIYKNVAKDKYYSNCFIYSIGINYSLKPLHNNILKKVIDKKIDGKKFSDRIWNNKNQVAKQVKLEVNKFLNGETDINNISSTIEKKFNANWYNSNRLVRDSIGRVQEGANEVWRKEHDIKYVLWDAALDKRTCDDCVRLDGEVFSNDKAPDCPAHVLCRCSLDSIVDKDWRPSYRIDNETKERVDWQSYEEWHKNYVENNPTRLAEENKYKNRFSDKKQYEKYKEILGKDVPKTFDKFQELKYNKPNEYQNLKEYLKYIKDNPNSDKSYFEINKKISELRDKNQVRIKGIAVKPPITEIKELNDHTKHRMEERGISQKVAQSFIDNSIVAFKQRLGTQYAFYSKEGFTAINSDGLVVSTGWLDEKGKLMIEEVLKKL
ncbi:minor capsid protein [uncultured Clostridium sp.]|uniref:minor capsid protein n=1 Tax=uncultured Clostridium sp. TaxID=59620 RepID=UPI0025E60F44|nr:minor capsid protein [uncultured Clostridium sp.]